MIFTQPEFFIFLFFTIVFLMTVPHHRVQKIFLLTASYYFYGYWNYRFLALIFICTLLNYIIAKVIAGSRSEAVRRIALSFSLIFCLGMLGYFKYYNFFVSSFQAMFTNSSFNLQTLEIILPVGISFFTFQALSYTIDVYRGNLKVCNDFWDFALYIAFFPQLVAGPIVRASEFLPQLESPRQITWPCVFDGTRQFALGLFKKVLIADHLAVFVDTCFNSHELFSGWTLALALLAYTLQILCDFSGYSDMAIGIAKIMGYDFNINFNWPYLSSSVSEFWHRWHISLSSWLRDYLYIPLGGSRRGSFRTYINLFLTMLLGGLWHGAAWTFVFWGAWHGGMLALHKGYQATVGKDFATPKFLSWSLTFIIVVIGWCFFRATSFAQATDILRRIATGQDGMNYIKSEVVGIIIIAGILHLSKNRLSHYFDKYREREIVSLAYVFLLFWLVILYKIELFKPFIYFQF